MPDVSQLLPSTAQAWLAAQAAWPLADCDGTVSPAVCIWPFYFHASEEPSSEHVMNFV